MASMPRAAGPRVPGRGRVLRRLAFLAAVAASCLSVAARGSLVLSPLLAWWR